ncbi:MAG: MFS transporter [Armatimonadota bacterium]|nr:MAG: MFS transporter [Armatimonadota bacterium]
MASSVGEARDRSGSGWRGVAALALGHGANDMYIGFLPALLPLIVDRLGLSYRGAGALVSILVVTSQLSQPLFGFLGDRVSRRALAIVGPLLTTLSMSWLGLLNSHELLLTALIMAGVGTAVFHPQGAALVGGIARPRSGAAMAVFTAGGNIGYGIGPVLIVWIVDGLGFGRTWLTMPIGLVVVGYLAVAMPRPPKVVHEASEVPARGTRAHWFMPLVVLYFVVMLRAAAATLFTTFVPLLIERRGEALILGGWALLGFSLAGAAGGFIGGRLSDSLGRRAITIGGLVLAAPAVYLFLHASGVAAAALLLIAGVCVFSALPVNIVMAQELVPRHASTVSGFVMGFAWGMGGLAAPGLGALADYWAVSLGELGGLARAMDLIALLPLAAAVLAIALPETRTSGAERHS